MTNPTTNLDPIRSQPDGVNVPNLERLITVGVGLVGAGLGVTAALLGSRRLAVIGGSIAAIGAGLIARGVSGRCPAYRARARRARTAAADAVAKHNELIFRGAGATTRQGVRDLNQIQ